MMGSSEMRSTNTLLNITFHSRKLSTEPSDTPPILESPFREVIFVKICQLSKNTYFKVALRNSYWCSHRSLGVVYDKLQSSPSKGIRGNEKEEFPLALGIFRDPETIRILLCPFRPPSWMWKSLQILRFPPDKEYFFRQH